MMMTEEIRKLTLSHISLYCHFPLCYDITECGPAAHCVKLLVGSKQLVVTYNTGIDAIFLLAEVFPTKGAVIVDILTVTTL